MGLEYDSAISRQTHKVGVTPPPDPGGPPGSILWATNLELWPSRSAPCVQGRSLSLQDAWSDQRGQIHLDSRQDYQLLRARRTPEGLSLIFKRPFDTCDPKDYLIEVGGGPTCSGDRGAFPHPGAACREKAREGSPRRLGGDKRPALLSASDPFRKYSWLTPSQQGCRCGSCPQASQSGTRTILLLPFSPPGPSPSGGILERAQETWFPNLPCCQRAVRLGAGPSLPQTSSVYLCVKCGGGERAGWPLRPHQLCPGAQSHGGSRNTIGFSCGSNTPTAEKQPRLALKTKFFEFSPAPFDLGHLV